MKNIAVIAGTPVDTHMGVDYLVAKIPDAGKDYTVFPYNAFENPRACHQFQMADQIEKEEFFTSLFYDAKAKHGIKDFFIYCNSLSAAFDFEALAEKLDIKLVTPLMAYRKLAKDYEKIAVIAANNQATAGIEKSFTDANPGCYVMGLGMLNLVEAVESKMPEAEIVEKFGLSGLVDFFRANGASALVLGCTHFPYFEKALAQASNLPIINPADIMFEMID